MALEKCPQAKKVVFLPNNLRKGKPNRAPLPLRARWLSFSMPIFNHSGWLKLPDKIVCDTRDCDYVVDILRDHNYTIVGLVGSDLCKPPKLFAQNWILVERNGFPIKEALSHLEGKQVIIIPNNETKWQNISSSYIREAANLSDKYFIETINMHVVPYFEKKFLGESLSQTTLKHEFATVKNTETFYISYIDDSCAQNCIDNLDKLKKSLIATLFHLPNIIEKSNNTVHFSRIHGTTLFQVVVSFIQDLISEQELEEVLTACFVLLQQVYFSKSLTFPHHFHCDPSAKNILYEAPSTLWFVDFENCKTFDDYKPCRKHYDRFSSSFEFYLMLHGYERDTSLLAFIKDCEKKAWIKNADQIVPLNAQNS